MMNDASDTTATRPQTRDAWQRSTTINQPVAWVADDDPEMCDVLADYLRSIGFCVEKFPDGSSVANELWFVTEERGRAPPELIVLDIYMPGYSGLDLIALLRRGDFQVPVIVITGAPAPEVLGAAEWLGALGVLEKPFEMRRLGVLASQFV